MGVNLDSSLNLESHFDKMYKRAAGSRIVLRKSTKQWFKLCLRIVELWVSVCHVPLKVEMKGLNFEVRKSLMEIIKSRQWSLIKRQSCQLVFDCLQDNFCTPFKGYFTKIEHNINTRNNGCSLKLPKTSQSKIRIWAEKFCLSRGSSLQYFTSAFKKFKPFW